MASPHAWTLMPSGDPAQPGGEGAGGGMDVRVPEEGGGLEGSVQSAWMMGRGKAGPLGGDVVGALGGSARGGNVGRKKGKMLGGAVSRRELFVGSMRNLNVGIEER
eukprot:410050-Rhodomonas_salina.1